MMPTLEIDQSDTLLEVKVKRWVAVRGGTGCILIWKL